MAEGKTHVFVFGAGASVGLGAPLTRDFLREGFELLIFEKLDDLSVESFKNVATLIDALYGTNLSQKVEEAIKSNLYGNDNLPSDLWFPFPQVTIEELFTFVDLGVANKQTWKPPFKILQEDLKNFVFETLDYRTRSRRRLVTNINNDSGTWSRNTDTCYDVLLDHIVDLNHKNCFITFNYDYFLDQSTFANHQDSFGNYYLNFDFYEHSSSYKENIDSNINKNRMIDLLKPHGSLNWACCKNKDCRKRHLALFRNYINWRKMSCNVCSGELTPILIPPTYKKRIEEFGLSPIWEKAHDVLRRAEEITIIGYSFPDADMEAKWLFKRAIVEGGLIPELTIVEPNKSVLDKIKGLFGNTVKYNYSYFGKRFEDFCSVHRLEEKNKSHSNE